MKSKEYHISQEGIHIRAWLSFPEGPTRGLVPAVILCHGIPGSRPDPQDRGYLDLIQDINAMGWACMAFNFRGCGLSGGNIDMQGWYRDLRRVFSELYNTPGIDPGSIHCLGFSAGGAIAARLAAVEENIASVLLLATPYRLGDILPLEAAALRDHFLDIGLIRDPDFPPDLEGWYDHFHKLTPGECVAFVSPRPVGIVHGEDDTLVPPGHARRLFEHALDPKRLILLPAADHHLRRDTRVSGLIRTWLKEVG